MDYFVVTSQSSGSGSESGNQTQSSSEQKSANNADYSDSKDDDNESIKLNARDGSDDGSGTQVDVSFCTFTARSSCLQLQEQHMRGNQLISSFYRNFLTKKQLQSFLKLT